MEKQIDLGFIIGGGSLIFFLLSFSVIISARVYKRTIIAKEKRIKEIELAKQIELFNAAASAEENEKIRIAQNLHDEIIPILNVLRQNLTLQKFAATKYLVDSSSFESNTSSIDRAIEGIRNTSHDLAPTILTNNGLERALEEFVSLISKAGTIEAVFLNSLPFQIKDRLRKNEELNIYRLSLEIVNNIIKHSKPTNLSLLWFIENNTMCFDFEHNGTGISNEEVDELSKNTIGLGLKSIKARCVLLNATLTYVSLPINSYVRVAIPLV